MTRRSIAGGVLAAFVASGAANTAPPPAAPRPSAAATAEVATAADSVHVPAGLGVPSAPVARVDGVPVIAASELARLLGATEFWQPDVRKLMLRLGEHRLTFSVDNPFVLIDDHTVQLEHLVVPRSGELQIPVDVARVLPRDGSWPRLAYDDATRQMRVAPRSGFVGTPRVEVSGGLTTLVVPVDHTDAVVVLGRSRARFRLRVPGSLVGALPDSLPDDALVRDLKLEPAPGGLTLELALASAAGGWRLERDPAAGWIRLVISHGGGAGFEEFASEGAPGPRVLRVVVLDPGHGGGDTGARAGGADEKSLALELAQFVAQELARHSTARVLLTRTDDRALTQDQRAEFANHAQADAVVSLHFDVLPGPQARGAWAWCAPATAGSGSETASRAAGLVTLRLWRDAAVERAVESRGLAESIGASLERRGFGLTSVRERLPLPLVGVRPPAILLDCGTLSNPDERARLLSTDGLRALAAAIAEGLLAW